MTVSPPPRSIILSNMKKKLYKLSQDDAAIASVQVRHRSSTSSLTHVCLCSIKERETFGHTCITAECNPLWRSRSEASVRCNCVLVPAGETGVT